MFDPLFPVMLFCGPFAFAILLYVEGKGATRRFWSVFARIVLALASIWGLTYWALIIAVGLFGEDIDKSGLNQVAIVAMIAAVAMVVAGCRFVARHRA